MADHLLLSGTLRAPGTCPAPGSLPCSGRCRNVTEQGDKVMGSGGDKVPWGRSVGWLDFDDRVQEKLQEAEEFTGNYVGAGTGFLGGRR